MIDTIRINGEKIEYHGSLEINVPKNLEFKLENGVLTFEEVDTEALLEAEIKDFLKPAFEKHPVERIPIALFGTIPKYECSGEEIANEVFDLMGDETFDREAKHNVEYRDFYKVYEEVFKSFELPDELFQRLRKENCRADVLVVAEFKEGKIEIIYMDYENEIWEMY